MRNHSNPYLLIVLPLLILSAFAISCGSNGEAQEREASKEDAVATPVEVAAVTRDAIAAYLTGTATLETEEEAEVVAKTQGIVEEILVEEGVRVNKGQVLARLDDEMLAIEVERARAELNRLESEFQRSKELFEKNLISKEEFQNARYRFEAQRSAFEAARLNLQYATIQAPISGVVARRYIKAGNMVRQNDPLFKIVNFDHLIANIHVPEVEIKKLRVGQRAELTFDATNGVAYTGRVERISPIVDPASGTVKVTVAVEDGAGNLKPGMFSRVRIIYDQRENALLIPKHALLSESEPSAVYVVSDSLALRRPVQTGYTTETMVEILEGLAAGEQVVVVGQAGLKDSARVEIVR